jgi:YaiO family outer membrane protein
MTRRHSQGATTRSAHCFRRFATAILFVCLTTSGPVHAQLSPDTAAALRLRAGELRRAERLDEAIALYRVLAAGSPHSFEDRFWIAKLSAWNGQPAAAESLFNALLVEQPSNYDSRIGLIDVRIGLHDYAAVQDDLESLARTHPNDPEILFRRGRVSEGLGNRREARCHFRQALAIRPDNDEYRTALRRVALDGRWMSGVEYYREQISGAPATSGTTAFVQWRPGERLQWRASASVQEKFGETEARGGLELAHRLLGTELRWSAHIAPGARVLPGQSYGAGVTQQLGRRLVLYGDYGLLDFAEATVHRSGPTIEWYLGRRWLVSARYVYTSTHRLSQTIGNHATSASLGYLYGDGAMVRMFGAVGGESFALPSIDATGTFRARTLGAEWRHFVSPWYGIAASYSYQDRSDGITQHSFGAGLVRRW